MAEGTRGGSSHGAAGSSGEPGITPEDLGDIANRVTEDEIEILDPDEVSAPSLAPEDPAEVVNADLVDDPEELRRTIEAAAGRPVEDAPSGGEEPGEPV